jgi:hypothetical protein
MTNLVPHNAARDQSAWFKFETLTQAPTTSRQRFTFRETTSFRLLRLTMPFGVSPDKPRQMLRTRRLMGGELLRTALAAGGSTIDLKTSTSPNREPRINCTISASTFKGDANNSDYQRN